MSGLSPEGITPACAANSHMRANLLADIAVIERVLQNLIDNALCREAPGRTLNRSSVRGEAVRACGQARRGAGGRQRAVTGNRERRDAAAARIQHEQAAPIGRDRRVDRAGTSRCRDSLGIVVSPRFSQPVQ